MGKEGIFGSEFVLLSCGDFDARLLKEEAERKGIFIPNYLKRWINIKKVFPLYLYDKEQATSDFNYPNTIYKMKNQVTGMTQMLEACDLKLEGH